MTAEQAPTESQPPAQPPEEKKGEESWEHKYKSIHGRFLRSQEQIRDMADQIQNLQNVIATLQMSGGASEVPSFKVEKLVTDDEARDYGEDFLNVVGKKAKEEVGPLIKQYEAKIEDMERQLKGVTGVVKQDSQNKLIGTLDAQLPKWRDLNTNDEFLDWLRLPDPFSGAIRHDMLKAAYAQGNASRVLAFFNGFLAEEAATSPDRGEPTTGTRVPKVPLESLAAPGRAKSAASASGPAEKPIFTRAQIASFYADVAAGRYRSKDAEKNKLEAQIFEATREGRIR
jgi:TolA-binding protein